MITIESSMTEVEVSKHSKVKTPEVAKPIAVSVNVTKAVRNAETKPATKSAAPKAVVKPTAKAPAKVPAKSSVKPVVKATPKSPFKVAAKSLPKVKAVKPAKEKKPKLIRDSFTIPKDEYLVLEDLKQRAGKLSTQIKKSELLRAGIKSLAAMSDAAFTSALKLVPTIKTGRPAKS
jgi:hypothetical protein